MITARNIRTNYMEIVTIEKAIVDLAGGTSKYNDYIRTALEAGKKLSSDTTIYQREVKK